MRYDLLHPKALHKALVEHLGTDENVPQIRQVRRWVSGDTPVPGWARRLIDEIMQAPAHDETAAPIWAAAMENRLRLEMRLSRALMESGVTPEEIEELRAELHAAEPHERPRDVTDPKKDQRRRDGLAGKRRVDA